MTIKYFLGLGSNIDPRETNLTRACEKLGKLGRIVKRSAIYRTSPWGEPDQPDFYNAVIEFDTTLAAQPLLSAVKQIEKDMGRRPAERWGPRNIDIDILFSPDISINETTLHIPHGELFNREFVLVPMAEIAADLQMKRDGKTVAECLAACPNHSVIEKLEINW